MNFMEMNVDKLKNPPKVYSDSDEESNQEAFRKAATATMRKRANEEKRVCNRQTDRCRFESSY